ncbi:MAG: hypothetical protein CEN91_123 [Candidatus Berkelbacteria bacterium Licking1014_85]|uniref:SpoVT-AbrB domain-containing protein n=1 Tax=Candidatus Berkelbacteria bacterium Licking1014_85 TaxID=2017148 RepID=A0A554LLN7_9BACT|nr:MAG: hypothetical protein CEN91_123 [Candidatus Berkelbacteria bacterium Licking1014_85]
MNTFTATLSSKGQFTIPKPIRDRLAVQKGAKLEVAYSANGFVVKSKVKPRILELAGSLKKYDNGTPTNVAIERGLEIAAREIANE